MCACVPANSRLSAFAIDAPSRRVHRHEHVLYNSRRFMHLRCMSIKYNTIASTSVLIETIKLWKQIYI